MARGNCSVHATVPWWGLVSYVSVVSWESGYIWNPESVAWRGNTRKIALFHASLFWANLNQSVSEISAWANQCFNHCPCLQGGWVLVGWSFQKPRSACLGNRSLGMRATWSNHCQLWRAKACSKGSHGTSSLIKAAFTWLVRCHCWCIPRHRCAAQLTICFGWRIWSLVRDRARPKHVKVGMITAFIILMRKLCGIGRHGVFFPKYQTLAVCQIFTYALVFWLAVQSESFGEGLEILQANFLAFVCLVSSLRWLPCQQHHHHEGGQGQAAPSYLRQLKLDMGIGVQTCNYAPKPHWVHVSPKHP